MPWMETCVMEERAKFVMNALEGSCDMTELCAYYSISRKTGYKWLNRYKEGGVRDLYDRSRAPVAHPHAMSLEVKGLIMAIKKRFPYWGARKIKARLERKYPGWSHYPALSTIGLFLKKQGLTCAVKRRVQCVPTETPLTDGRYSNHVWCADFKGHFRTRNRQRCNPLTISDHSSRFLLCCRHIDRQSHDLTKNQFIRIFSAYGLPEVIRTDNGTPFASVGLGGLSMLSYWWIRLGIHPERIEPGHPEQNGRHERMHKTLKLQTTHPVARNIQQQQRVFDGFRREYNDERPHEALQMCTPSEHYNKSLRPYPSRLPPISYPEHMKVYQVHEHGDLTYRGRRLFVSEGLKKEYVGFEQITDDKSLLWYCNYIIAELDHKEWILTPAKSRSLISTASCRDKGLQTE